MADAIQNMIAGMNKETLGAFCRTKSGDFVASRHSTITAQNKDLFPAVFQERFASVDIIGFFKNLEIFVFLIRLKDGSVLSERSCRRLQFDFAIRVLRTAHNAQHSIFTEWLGDDAPMNINQALFVFTDDNGSFRFSLVENLDRNAGTPKRFRRQTFFVDQEQSNNTFKKRMDLYRAWNSFNEMKEVFSVEKLSDEFFTEYKNIYQDFVEYATGKRMVQQGKKWVETTVHSPRTEVMAQFEQIGDAEKAFRDYVKKMMGRLVFLQFLQKKGWLGAPEGQEWGTGDKEYLRKLFKSKPETIQNNFLDTVLERLFFQSLNIDRTASNDIADELLSIQNGQKVRIPYLNGGLFENDVLDQTQVQFPKEIFEKLFDTFERFNFTIDENDPNDAEIGVDPEMLGRIFENLLEDNKDKGAFYTPKEIVQYMCRESLIAHLGDTHAVRKLVTYCDDADIADSDKETLITKLRTVKICDPAIGSGAFPMGMLHVVLNCRKQLERIDDTPAEIVRLKSQIIQNNIYGVDIEAGAVDIARLRFWLSIVVDEVQPIPLPNLDYKIIQGNSLLESFMGIDLSKINPGQETFTEKRRNGRSVIVERKVAIPTLRYLDLFGEGTTIDDILNDISAIYSETDHQKRDEIRARIHRNIKIFINKSVDNSDSLSSSQRDEIKRKAAEIKQGNVPYTLWHLYFADVFANGGFDIVIGNPPYIDSENMAANIPEQREIIKVTYPNLTGNWDIYMAFWELANIISKNIFVYITPDKWLSRPFGKSFRKNIMRNKMHSITYCGSNIFESATVDAVIALLAQKHSKTSFLKFNKSGSIDKLTEIDLDNLSDPYFIDGYFSPNLSLIQKMERASAALVRNIAECEGACATRDAYALAPLIENHEHFDARKYYKLINTGTLSKFISFWGECPITYLGEHVQFPVVSKVAFSESLGGTYQRRAASPKIIMKGLNLLDVCLDLNAEYIPGKTTLCICSNSADDLKLLCAILNSKAIFFYIKIKVASSSYCGGITFTPDIINTLPLPRMKDQDKCFLISIVDQIINRTCAIDEGLDNINKKVFSLYGFDENEMAIIEGSFRKTRRKEKVTSIKIIPNDDCTNEPDDDARD